MPSEEEIRECIERLKARDGPRGYFFNPVEEDLMVVIDGYLVNEEKFGYPACPCRLPAGDRETDLDIICPCDYRDDDVGEFGACYCSLYVSEEVVKGEKELGPVPERRQYDADGKPAKARKEPAAAAPAGVGGGLAVPVNVWRCPVCGYLAAKEEPPPKCPICGVSKDRFELFLKAA